MAAVAGCKVVTVVVRCCAMVAAVQQYSSTVPRYGSINTVPLPFQPQQDAL